MKHPFRRAWVACVAVAIASFAISAPALAQDSYYREVTVDGRIYVFTSEKAQKTWEGSKELAVGTVTRPGYGPNGETVVFEGPAAIEAFNKKYGKADAPPKDASAVEYKLPFDIRYRQPGLRFTFPKFEMNWSNRMQLRYTYDDLDSAAIQADRSSFRVRRMKTKLDGWIYWKELTYEFQVNWVGLTITNNSTVLVEDANLDYDFTGGKKTFRLKLGQYKAPFGRQELTSSGSQQFVDRSIASVLFAPARQVGAQIHGQFGDAAVPDMITYAGGVFNGDGINHPANDNNKMQYVARLMYSPFGNVGYSESNLEGYDFRISIAGDYNQNTGIVIPTTGDPTGITVRPEYGADIVIKAAKILSLYFEHYWRNVYSTAGVKTNQTGFTGQIGVLVLPTVEIAGRWSETDLNKDRDDRNIIEKRIGVSWYLNKHNLKLQADFGEVKNEGANGSDGLPPAKNKDARLQAQLIF